MGKLAVIAVGGNALIKDEQHTSVADQYAAAYETMTHIANLIENGWRVVITHGNGPQVGFILRSVELSQRELPRLPLDTCDAETQGAIGYMFQNALQNEFRRRGLALQAVTVVTQVVVDRQDPAFQQPSKPIGSFIHDQATITRMQNEGLTLVEDAGRGWRRVVPSPQPLQIVERPAIQTLVQAGFVVIAVGGGGIPVVANSAGDLIGMEAVIDKDAASALLASDLQADLLIVPTGVEKVALHYNQPNQRWLDRLTVTEAKNYLAQGHFQKGSMGPKIAACVAFLERGGQQAVITTPAQIERALAGETGTWIVNEL